MRNAEEVSEQGGMRWFIVTMVIAVLLGFLIRLTFAPHKIEMMIRAKIETSPLKDQISFANAEVSLANGMLPDLALVVNEVEWRPAAVCDRADGLQRPAPVRAKRLRVPLRWSSLLQGKPSLGRLSVDDLTVDLDDVKRRCVNVASGSTESKLASAAAAPPIPPTPVTAPESNDLFRSEEISKLSELARGIRVVRAEIYFENRMKSVVLEGTTATFRESELDVSTALRFPPSTVFGESLPAFSISGVVRRDQIQAEVRADLNEGTLEANAVLRPAMHKGVRELDAELKLSVSDLPLSMTTPLLVKSGIITGGFRPKFVWLDCGAEIKGLFSRLFVENPVSLSECEISGQMGRIRLQSATRLPDGSWKPFEAAAEKLDLAKLFDIFEIQGPVGVFTDFGKLDGKILVNSTDDFDARGKVTGATVRFAGGEGVALQSFSANDIGLRLQGKRLGIRVSDFKVDGGDAKLSLEAEIDRAGENMAFSVDLERLKLNSRVEKAIFTGPVGDITGTASATVAKSLLSKFKAAISMKQVEGTEFSAGDLKLEAQLVTDHANAGRLIEVTAKSPSLEVLKSGYLYRLLQPALLGWDGMMSADGLRMQIERVAIKGRFHDEGFRWTSAQAAAAPGVSLSSEGQVLRDHVISARLEAGYPLAPRLRWDVRGTWQKPQFATNSDELKNLMVRAGYTKETVTAAVPPRLLGITSPAPAGAGAPANGPAKKP